jgi:hypothetical protein
VADAVAKVARRNAADDTYESPYTVEALRQVPTAGCTMLICRTCNGLTTLHHSTCYESRLSAYGTMLQGIDLSWWEKLKAARLSPRSGFKLGKLQVCQEE